MNRLHTALAVSALITTAPAAFGQQQGRGVDPNLVHFYMARQEIQILDDAPAVNDMRTQPSPGSKQAPAPNRPQPLPHAGFMPYSQTIPSFRNSLPATFNGVPPKAPPPVPPGISPKSAKAGVYKGKKPAAGKPAPSSAPAVAKTYAPYEGYGNKGVAPVSAVSTAGGTASTRVQGSLLNKGPSMLHWSRTHSNQ